MRCRWRDRSTGSPSARRRVEPRVESAAPPRKDLRMPESTTAAETAQSNGSNGATAASGAGVIEVRRPVNGTLIRTVEIDSPESVAAKVARVRRNQPAWEALGIGGRYRWLKKLARLADRQRRGDHRPAPGGDRQGPSRRRRRGDLRRVGDPLLRRERRGVPRRGDAEAAAGLPEDQAAAGRLPPLRGRRRDQPLELPGDPRPRGCAGSDAGRLGRGPQAVRDHAADA